MTMRRSRKLSLAALLAGTALCVSACGGSGGGLIPSASAGPLRRDFEAVAAAAKRGNGNCGPTQHAIASMKRHYARLPSSVDVGLREKIGEGIENLTARALSLCEEAQTTSTSTTVTTITEETEITPTETEAFEETETSSPEYEEGGGVEAPSGSEEGENGEAGGTEVPEEGEGEVEGEREAPAGPNGGAGAP